MSKIERVARAICDRNPDAQVTLWGRERLMERLRPARYSMVEGETVPSWKLFEAKARAAIAAYEAVTEEHRP